MSEDESDQVYGRIPESSVADQVRGRFRTTSTENVSDLCNPCQVGGIDVPAVGQCNTCDELLCKDCFQGHCRLRMMRDHQLKLLKDSRVKTREQLKYINCSNHIENPFTYYCEDHKELSCNQCFDDKHMHCLNTTPLSALKESDISELKSIEERMKRLERRLEVNKRRMLRNIDIVNKQYEITVSNVKDTTRTLLNFLEDLEMNKIREAEEIRDEAFKKIEYLENVSAYVAATLAGDRAVVNDYANGDNSKTLFIIIKTVQKKIEEMEMRMEEVEKTICVSKCDFVINKYLSDILINVKELGSFQFSYDQNTESETDDKMITLEGIDIRPPENDASGGIGEDTLGFPSYDADKLWEVTRFQGSRWLWGYQEKKESGAKSKKQAPTDAINVSTDHDITLLYVVLYQSLKGNMKVNLTIRDRRRTLLHRDYKLYHQSNKNTVEIEVIRDNGLHGLKLKAGCCYSVCVIIKGDNSHYGDGGQRVVRGGGVTFTFRDDLYSSNNTTTSIGQIPGFKFKVA